VFLNIFLSKLETLGTNIACLAVYILAFSEVMQQSWSKIFSDIFSVWQSICNLVMYGFMLANSVSKLWFLYVKIKVFVTFITLYIMSYYEIWFIHDLK